MPNVTMPSTKLLPMADIANVLLAAPYEFAKKTTASIDTLAVNSVSSDLIAVAATDENGTLINDRETVKNALRLGDMAASEYLTKNDAVDLQNFGENVVEVHSEEIRKLRDELYQLRGQLVQHGVIKEYNLYEGFQDLFKTDNLKYQFRDIGSIKMDVVGINQTTLYPDSINELLVGDYFVINKLVDDTNNYNPSYTLVKVLGKNDALGSVTIDKGVSDLVVSNIKLFKSLGQYNLSSFSFSKLDENVVTEKEKYTMLNDDTATTAKAITASNSGYAAMFKIPDAVVGALSKFTIDARSVGSPGMLKCYVINESAVTTLVDLNTIEEEDLIAVSHPVLAGSTTNKMSSIDFLFQNPITGKYPILENKKYCFILVASTADISNRWEVKFAYHPAAGNTPSDLQANNNTFSYSKETGSNLALTQPGDITLYDLFFMLATKEVIARTETLYKEGLYSTTVKLPTPIEVSRARLMLRVNREGNFIVSSPGGIYTDGSELILAPDPSYVPMLDDERKYDLSFGTGLANGESIIVGTDIRKVTGTNGSRITIDKGLYLDKRLVPDPENPFDVNKDKEISVPVYRMGYEIYIKPSKVEWDPIELEIKTTNYAPIKLALKAIMPDGNKIDTNYSDRLLFEADLERIDDLPVYANSFEMQIKWNSNFDMSLINNPSYRFKELAGRIYDLTLSFDKSL
jgi:hypothetical protein